MTRQQNKQKWVDQAKEETMTFQLKQIGVIRTPYTNDAPYQPIDEDKEELGEKNRYTIIDYDVIPNNL